MLINIPCTCGMILCVGADVVLGHRLCTRCGRPLALPGQPAPEPWAPDPRVLEPRASEPRVPETRTPEPRADEATANKPTATARLYGASSDTSSEAIKVQPFYALPDS